jgi:membrane protein
MGTLRRTVHFLREDIWNLKLRDLPQPRRAALSLLRIALHITFRFSRNLAKLQAAGLTLVTLLAAVPTLAIVFALAGALGYGSAIDERMQTFVGDKDQPAYVRDIVEQLRQLAQHTNFGALGAIGAVVVLWSGLVLFQRIEQAFNHVWRTNRRRSWLRSVTDFVALLVFVPPLALGGLTLGSFLTARTVSEVQGQAPWLGPLFGAGLGCLPYVMAWIALTLLYRLMPSARVHWSAALAGGVIAGTGVVLLHDLHIRFQVGVARLNEIYAAFAAVPLLLVYLQVVWTVVLVGAEVCYAVQNLHALRGTENLPPPTPSVRRRLAWHLVQHASEGFRAGRRGVRASEVAMELDVPAEWMEGIGDDLVASGLLVQVVGDGDLVMPSRPPEQIRAPDVLGAAEGTVGRFLERVRLADESERMLATAEQDTARALSAITF